jgi:hypothetical protein
MALIVRRRRVPHKRKTDAGSLGLLAGAITVHGGVKHERRTGYPAKSREENRKQSPSYPPTFQRLGVGQLPLDQVRRHAHFVEHRGSGSAVSVRRHFVF